MGSCCSRKKFNGMHEEEEVEMKIARQKAKKFAWYQAMNDWGEQATYGRARRNSNGQWQ